MSHMLDTEKDKNKAKTMFNDYDYDDDFDIDPECTMEEYIPKTEEEKQFVHDICENGSVYELDITDVDNNNTEDPLLNAISTCNHCCGDKSTATDNQLNANTKNDINSNSINGNVTNANDIMNKQENTDQVEEEIETKTKEQGDNTDINDPSYQPLSCVYLITAENRLYKLTFNVYNAFFVPLYFHQRDVLDKSNDKSLQPFSKSCYKSAKCTDKYKISVTPFRLPQKKEFICYPQKHGLISKMSTKSALVKKNETFPPFKVNEVKKSSSISNINKHPLNSEIYVRKDNILFKINAGVFFIEKIKPKQVMSDNFDKIAEQLGLSVLSQRVNKSSLMVRYKNDLINIRFSMKDISFDKFPLNISRGTQCVDNSIYIRIMGAINDRKIMFSVPKSTYVCPDLRHITATYAINHRYYGRIPDWQDKQRIERLKTKYEKKHEILIEKHMKASHGSTIFFDCGKVTVRAITGMVKTTFPCGTQSYEDYVVNEYRCKAANNIARWPSKKDEFFFEEEQEKKESIIENNNIPENKADDENELEEYKDAENQQ